MSDIAEFFRAGCRHLCIRLWEDWRTWWACVSLLHNMSRKMIGYLVFFMYIFASYDSNLLRWLCVCVCVCLCVFVFALPYQPNSNIIITVFFVIFCNMYCFVPRLQYSVIFDSVFCMFFDWTCMCSQEEQCRMNEGRENNKAAETENCTCGSGRGRGLHEFLFLFYYIFKSRVGADDVS